MAVLDTISTQSADITMAADASGNRYLTNTVTSNTNISRELLRQIYLNVPERFAALSDSSGVLLSVPLIENDTLNIKVVMEPSPGQHTLTNVGAIPPREYNIKLVIKNTVGGGGAVNTTVVDSVSFPNAYPYSSNVQDISASISQTNVSCNGGSNGTITVSSASGGSGGAYTASINNIDYPVLTPKYKPDPTFLITILLDVLHVCCSDPSFMHTISHKLLLSFTVGYT